ncbi:hypothetical protein PB2503_04807 [Parvularcula bermudensis HTCC2503]|uniref:Uncharacterized protein n=1 Tax=Parvularcula bermudensis (strain ATCC BAA-594 / HTCC2503 / KCTC 12087) TaxID=314260 RepID=E0TFB8_PARBH|nr:hypothetical protein PB2503_04807 [Parvularcula bermudensis HTCC2503]
MTIVPFQDKLAAGGRELVPIPALGKQKGGAERSPTPSLYLRMIINPEWGTVLDRAVTICRFATLGEIGIWKAKGL